MTKDWEAVQDEIRELSFNQKKCLEDVKELMERKYKFRASTRAYRMKLKEWGFMRHKPRRTAAERNASRESSHIAPVDNGDREERDSSATIEPTPAVVHEKQGGWKIVPESELAEAEPTFMGLLHQSTSLEPTLDPWAQAGTRATEIVMDMLGAMLDNDTSRLESLIVENPNHVNDPIGMPFETPNSRFFAHPVMNHMVVLQHPDQTLLDIACGMPCGPNIWILLSHGAKGSRHPYGTDLALHNAIKNGRPYTVQAMLVPGRSSVNGVPGIAWKPLLQAAFWNHPEVVRILLRKGANLEDAGPSPTCAGTHTALQLCLNRRADDYVKENVRDKCNQVLRMLLEAGANVHVAPVTGSTLSPFELFTKPWQTTPYWATKLSVTELDCLRMFVNGGANLQVLFDGYPCTSTRRTTFEHQVLWHSTPAVARLVVDSFSVNPQLNDSSILHEILGTCPDAKRHPAETLRDIQVLLHKGADPNHPDMNGITPLRKCTEQCPAVDFVARLQMLLNGGADPEAGDRDGVQPFILAARTIEEPLLSEAMQAMVGKMRGNYTRTVDNVSRTWNAKHFPISETQTYEQVMSCSRSTGDFRLELQDMVPADVRETFQRAYFSVISKNFLDTMARTAKARMLTPRDKDEIVWIVLMRKGIDLPEYKFDQELVIALMDPQPLPSTQVDTSTIVPTAEITDNDTMMNDAAPESNPPPTTKSPAPSSPPRTAWQFNPNNTTTPSPPRTPKELNIDELFPSTTQIRWMHPDRAERPGDFEKACISVLMYKCGTCDDDVPLTKSEQEKHGVEHAHTSTCGEEECERRFCVARRKRNGVGCQDHLFGGEM
ncbi:ankyrin [Ophiobolus disseminans]|uniref:Ankyrin n=1 Tax=Ophiobolus disseminans TaxID=1469910 RepID=A0A6A6ZMI9_9PLEO|nr:ankyrin [Ophiobolus disseminans]